MNNVRVTKMLGAALATAALSFAVSACGSENSADKFSGEKKEVAQAVEDFVSAVENEESKKLCTELIGGSLKSLFNSAGTDNCIKAFDQAAKGQNFEDLNVEEVTINGTTATVKTKSKSENLTLELTKEQGKWKVSSLPQ